MDKTIYLNQSNSIDLPTLLDTRLLVQANSGGGKSWLLRRILEQSHGKVQQIVIDLEGEFATLRERYDYVLAGKDGDTPADPRSAGLLAKKLLELNVSAIIDLYELHLQERKHFVRLFLESMINAPKTLWHPCLVVIDEAHKFCPEKEQSEASSAVIDLATLGRKRGYCAILATQRLSKLHKDAAAECNNKLIGRTGLDVDMRRAGEELGFSTKDHSLALRNLAAGEFFAFGPAISPEVIKVTIGTVKTTHPKAGSRIVSAAPLPPTENIKKILGALKDLPQEAEEEARTIEGLQDQIARLKRERAPKPQGTESSVPAKEIDTAVKTALQRQQQHFDREKQQLETRLERLTAVVRSVADTTAAVLALPEPTQATNQPPVPNESPPPVPELPQSHGAAAILCVIQTHSPMVFSKTLLAEQLPAAVRNSAYGLYLSLLEQKGLIRIENNRVVLTDAGKNPSAQQFQELAAAEKTLELWKSTLKPGAKRMLAVLADIYPRSLSKKELGLKTGLSPTSGTFNKYYRLLKDNGLIAVSGQHIRVSETLFF
jgi:uncharacterized protein